MEKTPLSVNKLIQLFKSVLKDKYQENEILSFVYILFGHFLGLSRTAVHLEPGRTLTETEAAPFFDALASLEIFKPIQYITGIAYFAGMEFRVNPDVLIPRPETEELLGLVISEVSSDGSAGLTAIDIGTGSGCIAVGLKKSRPGVSVTAIDISAQALAIARNNANANSCSINFCEADILDPLTIDKLALYDLVISNPPYVLESEKSAMKANVVKYEPEVALFVGDRDPLVFYRAIAAFARQKLKVGGKLFFEINESKGRDVTEMLANAGFSPLLLRDMHGRDRFIRATVKTD
jgi:release factor glutamine methyltransferase